MENREESESFEEAPLSARKKIAIFFLCFVIVGATYAISMVIISSGPKPKKKKPEDRLVKVRVEPIVFENRPIVFELNGTVEPSKNLMLKSEISGLIVEVNPKVEIGQKVKQGETLFRLESLDFKSDLANKQAALSKAEMELEIEKGRQSLSKKEWESIQLADQASEQEKSLALRQPQLKMALASVKSAKAAVDLAKKNLERTVIKAPFDALIIQKNVELGARISPQESLLQLAAASPYWVRVTLAHEKLNWIKFRSEKSKGSRVDVSHLSHDTTYRGEVLRFLPNMENSTRMAQILVEVDPNQGKENPLLLNSYVKVHLLGDELKDVVRVHRRLLSEGKHLHILNKDNKLDIRSVETIADGRDAILVKKGLMEGDRLIVSQIPAAVQGMTLSVLEP